MSTASERLALLLAAEAAILKGQEVAFEGRRLRYPDYAEVRAEIDRLTRQVASEEARASGRSSIRFSVARMD